MPLLYVFNHNPLVLLPSFLRGLVYNGFTLTIFTRNALSLCHHSFVVARRTAKNSLEKTISLEKARRGRLQKYWPFRSTNPRADEVLG